MKHIIIPLCDSLGAGYDYLQAISDSEKDQYGMVVPSENLEPELLQQGKHAACWKYSVCMTNDQTKDALRAVFEQLRSDIDPLGGESFLVDLVVDAANAELAEQLLPHIRKAGQWYRIHVVFLSERDSQYGREQASFFTKIRNDSSGKYDDSGLGWTWLTMLADENRNGATGEIIKAQREELLPFLFTESFANLKAHSCYTYAVSYRKIHFEQVPEIPRVQSIRFVSKAVQAHEVYNELGILLMNGEVCPEKIESQMEILKKNLLSNIELKLITGQDLLIHRHDPTGDASTRDLLSKLLRDNPEMDARIYDRANSEEELYALPKVKEAVVAWEKYVLEATEQHTNLERIRDQLINDSEWLTRIKKDFQSSYYHDDPLQLCTSTLKGKDGYGEKAAESAQNDLQRINQQIERAIFQACLRLLAFEARHVYAKIEDIIHQRETAAQELFQSVEGYEETERMTKNWCEQIQGRLLETSDALPLTLISSGDTRGQMEKYAELLLNHINNQIRISDGLEEMASSENTDYLMRTIKETTTPYQLINPALAGSATIRKDEKWFVSDKMHPTYDADKTEPTRKDIVLLATSYYLYPAADTAPDPEKTDYTDILFHNKVLIRTDFANKPANIAIKKNEMKQEWPGEQKVAPVQTVSNMKFTWEYPEADMVSIRYLLYGTREVIYESNIAKVTFGGNFMIQPPASLPSGARIEIVICFMRAGHEIGEYRRKLFFETQKEQLTAEEETYAVKVGFLKKAWYHRLRVREQTDLNGRIGIRNMLSGCVCSNISWYQDGMDCVSEPLPEGGVWSLVNRDDTPYVYQIET